jgi:hypothetical protein
MKTLQIAGSVRRQLEPEFDRRRFEFLENAQPTRTWYLTDSGKLPKVIPTGPLVANITVACMDYDSQACGFVSDFAQVLLNAA